MIGHDEAQAAGVSPLAKLALALQAETAGKQQKVIDFEEAYPTLEQHLKRKVPVRVVLAKFNAAYGHGLHPPAFRKLLEAERKRREETGTVVTCVACNQLLVPANDVDDQEDEA